MKKQNELFAFEDFYQNDESDIDLNYPQQVLLYYSEDEKKELDYMTKLLIKHYYGDKYKEGNRCDLILKLFRNECKKINTKKNND
tara:strand:+ start:321 stop:575 length:255 start_codon:yes stop_codon:yes gene_type:complete